MCACRQNKDLQPSARLQEVSYFIAAHTTIFLFLFFISFHYLIQSNIYPPLLSNIVYNHFSISSPVALLTVLPINSLFLSNTFSSPGLMRRSSNVDEYSPQGSPGRKSLEWKLGPGLEAPAASVCSYDDDRDLDDDQEREKEKEKEEKEKEASPEQSRAPFDMVLMDSRYLFTPFPSLFSPFTLFFHSLSSVATVVCHFH